MRSLWVVLSLGLAACYSPDFGDGRFACGPSGECPRDLTCGGDSMCHTGVGGAPDAGSSDADLTPMVTVSLAGGGTGTVTSSPSGISCGTQCTSMFPFDSQVTLTAAADAPSVFAGWTGGDCSGDATCALTVDQARTAQATFELHGAHRWIDQISFPGQDSMDYVATDAADNVIAAGTVVPTEGGASFPYVKKYANDGTVLWANQIATDCGIYDGGLAVDADGNVYIGVTMSGFNNSCTTFGGTAVTGDLFGNIGVARLRAADGHVDWVKQYGGSDQDRPHAMAVSGTNLFVTGETSSTDATFGTFTFAASSGHGFLAKLDTATGNVIDAKDLPGNIQIWDMAASATDVLVVGAFHTNMTIDGKGINVSSGAHSDVMIYDFAIANPMSAQWAKGAGDPTGDDSAYGVAAVPGGGWVVTGAFYGNILFAASGTSLVSAGSSDVFVARYDASGNHVYSFGYGGAMSDIGDAVAVDAKGNVLLAGRFATDITFGAFTLTGASNTDTFLTKLSSGVTPVHQWAVKYGGTAYDDTRDLAVDSSGNPFLIAQWTGMTVVDGVSLTAQDYDGYVLAAWR